MGELAPEIRRVTPETLEIDLRALQAGELALSSRLVSELPEDITAGKVDFFLAYVPEVDIPVGRIGISRNAPRSGVVRSAFEATGIIDKYEQITEVAYLKVREIIRRRGIGRLLLQRANYMAFQRGAYRSYACVATDNPIAEQMFLKLGYCPTDLVFGVNGTK
jgi:GNAT superfamily N-acetyltransferase